MREIPEEVVGQLLSNKDALAACDIAVFVHDRYLFPSIHVIMSKNVIPLKSFVRRYT